MKTKLFSFLVLGITILSFSSCDPGLSYSKVILNDSKYDIKIISVDTPRANVYNVYEFDTLLVAKHSSEVIASEGGIGAIATYSSCNQFNDSIYAIIVGFDSLHLNIDISDSMNWTYLIIEETNNGGGTCECRLKITNSMIK